MRRLPVALVGAGLVGQAEHAHHLWDDRARFELVAIVDASATVRSEVAARYGVPRHVATLAELDDAGLEAIVCAVPDGLHCDVVVDALRRGLHVLCEKPLALSLDECDEIAAAAREAERIVQVGYMKRHDPSFRRLLELLPDRADDIVLVTVEVNDPDEAPFVDHLGLVRGSDVPPEVIADGRERAARRIAEALGGEPSRAAARAFEAYLSSMVHDVNLVHGLLEAAGEPLPLQVTDAAAWDRGRGVSLSFALAGGGRATLLHQNLPGVNDYRERVTVYCRDRILELEFPSPYLRHHPTRLHVRRSDGVAGLREEHHRASFEEAFREELRAFHAAVTAGGPVIVDVDGARADVEALLEAFRRSQERALSCP